MEGAGSDKGSDYIANFDFVPPSPRLEPVFDYPPFDSVPITSPPLPYTSSYNGSYYSPYSQHSELSFSDNDIQLDDFPGPINEYEPSDYDAPNQPVSLLMFTNDSDFMSPHFSTNTFEHSSPSSNASGVDDNIHLDDSLSRRSSVASNHLSPAIPSSPQPTFHASPRLSVDFGNMSVNTPNWGTVPLPQHSAGLFPVQKAQSPPRLLMLDEEQNIPTINAPNEDDQMMNNGPQFCIVPATPVSGGGAGRTNVPFQTTLSTLTQGTELAPSINHQQSSQQQQPQTDPSPSTFPGTEENLAVTSSSTQNNATSATNGFIFPNNYPQQLPQQQQQSRPRTHSDPWNPNFLSSSGLENANVASEAAGAYDFSRQLQTFTFGGPPSTSNNGNGFLSPHSPLKRSASDGKYHRHSRSENIRSPMPYGGGNNGHTVNGPGYHQQSRSIGSTTAASNAFLFPPTVDLHTGQQQQQQQFLHPSQVPSTSHHLGLLSAAGSASNPNLSLSSNNNPPTFGHFHRASSAARSDRGAEVWGSLGSQGHHTPRRMSPYPTPNASPSRRYTDLEFDSDLILGGGNDNNNNGTMGLGMGMGMGDFGEPPASAGFSDEIPLSRRGSYAGLDVAIGGGPGGSQKAESIVSGGSQPRSNIPSPSQTDMLPSQIPKVNVTTGRTANASHRRRKQDANFACTVPGCGSTFTRGFNLKGHLRSHYELKPYKCQWPGCGKGFARQHDCKRHEQLHKNFRPFECDGCRKQFARMDALNRHLKSDAGVDCAKIAERERGADGGGGGGTGNGAGYDMGGMAMSMTGMLSMELEEQKYPIPRRKQSGGADSRSGVAL